MSDWGPHGLVELMAYNKDREADYHDIISKEDIPKAQSTVSKDYRKQLNEQEKMSIKIKEQEEVIRKLNEEILITRSFVVNSETKLISNE